ncbi:claudin-23 [Protopterus annectens]|uniref:claudin-23 n=1 Tax=Protopterus annectens TaxID=7888 RepID=UPI001CFA0946|nr:claudin-23 [Protopterus annectens]
MQTPVVMIIGIVCAPCGLVLALVCTVAPGWRDIRNFSGASADQVSYQGIWDICQEYESTHKRTCGVTDDAYFQTLVIQVARGLMLASLGVTTIGIILASLGIRCWRSKPNYLFAGLGGIVIFISGVLSLIPQSWYTNQINAISSSSAPNGSIQTSYALVVGFIGSCLELIGGFSLALSFAHFCVERQNVTANKYFTKNPKPHITKPVPKSYTNPMEVTDGPSVASSPVPCDSDL